MADIAQKANVLLTEMRQIAKKANTSDSKVKLEKMGSDLDKLSDENQKIFLEKKALEEKMAENEARLEAVEKSAFRPSASLGVRTSQTHKIKSFLKFCKEGGSALSADEKKALRTDINTQGGYLAPPEYVEDIIKRITEMTPLRQFARVRQTSREAIEIPTRTDLAGSFWVGECATLPPSQSAYGLEVIKVNKLGINTIATVEMLTDAAFNMDAEIQSDAVESMSFAEGEVFVNGTGANQPQGILADSDVETIFNGGVAPTSQINLDALIEMRGSLKTGYNGAYFANRRTIANMRLQQDGTGRYLMDFFTQTGVPATIFGDPLVETPALPDIAAGSFPLLYGDMNKGYTIVDGEQISVIRDNFTLADQGKVKFIWFRRVGGQVVLPEAIKKLEMSAVPAP